MNVAYIPQRALEQLRIGSGHPAADFRDGQEGAIRACGEGRRRLLERIVRSLPANLRVLGPNLQVTNGDLNRATLSLLTIRLPDQAQRLAWLAGQLASLEGHGIIYTLTVRVGRIFRWRLA